MGTKGRGTKSAKRVQDHIREDMEFDSIRWNRHKFDNARQNRNRGIRNCKYFGRGHP